MLGFSLARATVAPTAGRGIPCGTRTGRSVPRPGDGARWRRHAVCEVRTVRVRRSREVNECGWWPEKRSRGGLCSFWGEILGCTPASSEE